jgi:hypothetical protein
MNSEAQKMTVIYRHLSQILPGWRIEDGSRTGVDRTIMLFDGATLRSTIQIGMDLLQNTRLSPHELELTLRNRDLGDWTRSGPVVYLNNNTLGIKVG